MKTSRRKVMTLLLLVCLCPILYVIMSQYNVTYKIDDVKVEMDVCKDLQPTTVQAREAPMKRILVVTYGRSGSTFTSYILKEAPEAFFFFEPLRPLLMRSTGGLDVIMSYKALGGQFLDVQEQNVSNLTSYERKALDVLNDLFVCDIGRYPVNDYKSIHFQLHGDVAKVNKCLGKMGKESYLNLTHYLQCLLDFWHACHVSPVRIFKVIRLPVRAIFSLMYKYPDLHVLYLVRDPRAILTSQRALFGHAPDPSNFCSMVEDDAAHMQLLKVMFPSRAVSVRYEDIANDPLDYTQRLYKALGLPLTPQVETRVRTMTSRGSDKSAYSSFRADSKKAASDWRTRIKIQDVRADDKVCGAAYDWLGYRPAGSLTVLRDLNVSLIDSSKKLTFL